MQPLKQTRTIALPARSVHRIQSGKGQLVTCLKGVTWITQANDERDIILSEGQSFVLDRQGLAVVFALKEAAIIVGVARLPAMAPEPERAHAA